MWKLYVALIVLVVVFLISYKPGSGLLEDWFGIQERSKEKQESPPSEKSYKVTSRDLMNASSLDKTFGIQE